MFDHEDIKSLLLYIGLPILFIVCIMQYCSSNATDEQIRQSYEVRKARIKYEEIAKALNTQGITAVSINEKHVTNSAPIAYRGYRRNCYNH